MSSGGLWNSLGTAKSIADVLGEVDVRPLREAAERPFRLAFISRDLPLARRLVALLYQGPRQHDRPPPGVCDAVGLDAAGATAAPQSAPHLAPHLALLVTRDGPDQAAESSLAAEFRRAGIPLVVCCIDRPGEAPPLRQQWLPHTVVSLPTLGDPADTLDDDAATRALTRAIRSLRAVDDLSLARHLPAFRDGVVKQVIEDTAVANGAYSIGTGILEINPVVDVPLNVADLVVLTKNQAIMAYKIALAMGLPPDFRHIMPQMAAVLGTGFLIRQATRFLVGLAPGWGIVPKVAIAFAGTYAAGEAISVWCARGETLAGDRAREVYQAALARGQAWAAAWLKKRGPAADQKVRKGLKELQSMLKVGDPIPDFRLAADTLGEVSAAGLAGRRYVLYFYPKDDTPGCTAEACNFRDHLPEFAGLSIPVYGVSPDTPKSHARFAGKHGLNFPLLADPDRQLIEAVGAWVEKRRYGRTYMGVQRCTFVVGPDGRIEKVWESVTPAGHAREVLDYLRSSQPSTAAI